MRVKALAVCVVTVLASGPAWAASAHTTFAVTARVDSVCVVGNEDRAPGISDRGPRTRHGHVQVSCTRGTTYNLSPPRDGVGITTITY